GGRSGGGAARFAGAGDASIRRSPCVWKRDGRLGAVGRGTSADVHANAPKEQPRTPTARGLDRELPRGGATERVPAEGCAAVAARPGRHRVPRGGSNLRMLPASRRARPALLASDGLCIAHDVARGTARGVWPR